MDALYLGILDILNGLIPSTMTTTSYYELNEFLAYVLTILIIYGVLFRPLLKLTKVVR